MVISKKSMGLLVVLIWVIAIVGVSAQDGRWVSYSRDGLGSGSALTNRGDGLLIYAMTSSQYVVMFDADLGEWQQFDVGTMQAFEYVETEGKVAMAYSGSLLFGYSAIGQAWDTITYVGTVLREDYTYGNRSYACGENLAFFATDQRFYAFDAAVGEWQEYEYGLPGDFALGYYYVKDDYIVLRLGRSTSYVAPKLVVYSAHTRSFNQLEYGCWIYKPIMDHGFASSFESTGSGTDFTMVGYSAFDNEFDVFEHIVGEDESCISSMGSGTLPADQFTAYMIGFRTLVEPYEAVTVTFYGYDTRHGEWVDYTYDVDWNVESYYGNMSTGGQIVADFSMLRDPQRWHFHIFNGATGSFVDYQTDLVYKSTTSSRQTGGTVMLCWDTLNAWAYDAVGNQYNQISLARDKTTNVNMGEDFFSLTRWTPDVDAMTIYFYNGNTNQWSWVETADYHTGDPLQTEHLYMFRTYPEGELVFYSSHSDEIVTRAFPEGTSISMRIRGDMASARSDNLSFIFDGINGTVEEFDFSLSSTGLGMASAVTANEADSMLYGYSALTGNLSSLRIDYDPYSVNDTGSIGLVTAPLGYLNYSFFYAYNGFADSWVELIPEGSHQSFLVGKSTILVVRSDTMYAFDPQHSSIDCCGLYTAGYTGNANCDTDGKRNIADISRLVDRVYVSKTLLCCEANGDVNGDIEAKINLADIARLIDHVYISKMQTAACR